MSTELVDYEALLSSMAKQAASTERPATSTVSFKSGMLSYNGTPVQGNKLDAVIIASTHANFLYEGKYDPNNISNPDCFAYSADGSDMKPHPSVVNPRNADCATCPNNQWGSDPSGGKGKACKNQRILGLIPASTKPEEVMDAEVAIAKLPVTSAANFGTYVNKIATLFNRPPLGMVTTVGTVPDLKSQFKVTFTNVGPVDNAMLKPLIDKAATVQTMLERVYEPNVEAPAEDTTKKKKF